MKYHTKWESDKIKKHHTQESQKVGTFRAGDLNAARNRQDGITKRNLKYK